MRYTDIVEKAEEDFAVIYRKGSRVDEAMLIVRQKIHVLAVMSHLLPEAITINPMLDQDFLVKLDDCALKARKQYYRDAGDTEKSSTLKEQDYFLQIRDHLQNLINQQSSNQVKLDKTKQNDYLVMEFPSQLVMEYFGHLIGGITQVFETKEAQLVQKQFPEMFKAVKKDKYALRNFSRNPSQDRTLYLAAYFDKTNQTLNPVFKNKPALDIFCAFFNLPQADIKSNYMVLQCPMLRTGFFSRIQNILSGIEKLPINFSIKAPLVHEEVNFIIFMSLYKNLPKVLIELINQYYGDLNYSNKPMSFITSKSLVKILPKDLINLVVEYQPSCDVNVCRTCESGGFGR